MVSRRLSISSNSLIVLLGPFVGFWLFFWMMPLIFGVDLSMRSDLLVEKSLKVRSVHAEVSDGAYVGFDNYRKAYRDEKFWRSLKNSIQYVLGTVLLTLPLALALAIRLIGLPRKAQGLLLFLLMIPGLAMPSVLSTLFYLFFHGREGFLNQYLILPLGLEPVNWMMDPSFIMPCMIFQSVWRWTGLVTLFFLCGLEGIPRWQLEVAKMEGLGGWSKLRILWMPGIGHLILFAAIFLTVDGFASFSGAYVLLGGSGGILDSGLLFVTYLYQVAFPGGSGRFDFPTATAMSLMVMPFLATLLYGILRIRRHRLGK